MMTEGNYLVAKHPVTEGVGRLPTCQMPYSYREYVSIGLLISMGVLGFVVNTYLSVIFFIYL